MKERPILFNTPMVQAILSGQKTQTRRIVNKAPTTEINHRLIALDNGWSWQVDQQGIVPTMHREIDNPMVCPFGQIGDRLWVRETFRLYDSDECPHADFPCGCPKNGTPLYKASHDCGNGEKWKPSIHMPRKAARLFLEITNIRIERLNDITSEDAKAEGFDYSTHPSAIQMGYAIGAKTNFRVTWEQIYGQNEWNKNPWVWVLEFKVIQGGAV
ncbi:hypothetical protein [Acinetobacter modestus]|uniref:Morphogenetic protein n=1 Tax=Acinetobacter modestus TaxID=1776740 RepID=A0ABP2TXJ9_9GAMM|nr:hypothetical protein [Acinetobacter modestus]ENU27042.1 hypothetical protein F992_01647 [Acinetobacter modestus]GGA17919.1 hypothetical protein GCM10017554_13390 [Acinetobacter modestus]